MEPTQLQFALVVLILVNFSMIGLLPRIFFRADGKFNLMWWLTAGPFFIAPVAVVANQFSTEQLPGLLAATSPLQQTVGVLFACASIILISFTLGTHRIPLALWHQENDAPRQIVTWGAYKRIRHPFYTSFILGLTGAMIALPHVLTLLAWAYGIGILNFTAAKEEQKLSSSEFGKEYIEYKKNTGRFFPRLSA